MKYMGSKARIAKHILPIILADKDEYDAYIEPFAGGMNMIDKVENIQRYGWDVNPYLISMFKALQSGWMPPEHIEKDYYYLVKGAIEKYPPELVGWIGFNCSYSGKWFGGYAGKVKTKTGIIRNYQEEARRNVLQQMHNLKDVVFQNNDYRALNGNQKCIVYCDPPYAGTTKYKDDFNHDIFWDWVRKHSKSGMKKVFVSEYNAPDDFECIWEMPVKSSLSANGKAGGNKNSIEKLWRLK